MVPIVPETGNFRKIFGTIFQNVLEISVLRKKIVPEFRFSRTFSIMEMEKISGSFPYVNRNPEFRWKPYPPPFKIISSECNLHTFKGLGKQIELLPITTDLKHPLSTM